MKPLLHQFLDPFLRGGRCTEARKASHSGAISISGGRLATVPNRCHRIRRGVESDDEHALQAGRLDRLLRSQIAKCRRSANSRALPSSPSVHPSYK